MKQIRHLLALMLLLPFITGCASGSKATGAIAEDNSNINDRSCAYSFFLWGAHAEYSHHFDEALEAYEKALICDPAATYIEKKLPVLLFRLGETERAATLLREGIAKDPEDISQYLLLAYLAIQQNQRDEAIEIYKQVLKRDPANDSVRLRLGILAVQQKRLDEGEQIFRDLITRDQEMHLARIYLARLLTLKGDKDASAKMYEETLRLNWSDELAFEMIDFYATEERYSDILRLYDTLIANDSTNERAVVGRVQTLLSLGRDEEALVELQNLRENNNDMDKLDMAIAKTLLRVDKSEEAKSLLETLRGGEVGGEANYLLGLLAFQDKRMESALSYFQDIRSDSIEYADGVYMQTRILRDFGRFDRAFSLLQKATAEPVGRSPVFFALLASLHQEKGKTEEAMAVITAGLVAFPESEQLHFEHALLLERSGLREQAIRAMQRVLEKSPDNPEALNYIGYTWADLNINLEQAREYILKAVELKPDNGFIRDSLGWVEFRLGNYQAALSELQKALELEPEDPNILVHLGELYEALKQPEEARKAYTKALELFTDTDTDEKNSLEKKLNALKEN